MTTTHTTASYPAAPLTGRGVPVIFTQASPAREARISQLEAENESLRHQLKAAALAKRALLFQLAHWREIDRIQKWRERAACHGLVKAHHVRPVVTLWSNAIEQTDSIP